ncbi:MAG: SDR family oxidoreductase [Nitrospirae bacterium]|nr:SDR family oxidoreductase [Nitrospirota bacterium]
MAGLLKDKVVVITGAAGLLGKTFSHAVADNNGIVIISDVDSDRGLAMEKELNDKHNAVVAKFHHTDITDTVSVDGSINAVRKDFGKIDALVNNAYPRNKNYGKKFEDVTYMDFCENVNLHLGGYFLISQRMASYFSAQGYGNIINIASIYGVVSPRFDIYDGTQMTMPVEYAVIKSAIIHLTRYMAAYFKGKNVRVNCISPGGIFDGQPESFIERYNSQCLSKGILDVKDIVGVLMFLLSDDSKYVNGHNIVVDDGFCL